MRPPILRWKVSLALGVVVVAAAILGSVLHSSGQSPARNLVRGTVVIRPFAYQHKLTPKMMRQLIVAAPKVRGLVFLPARETPLDRLRAWLDRFRP